MLAFKILSTKCALLYCNVLYCSTGYGMVILYNTVWYAIYGIACNVGRMPTLYSRPLRVQTVENEE